MSISMQQTAEGQAAIESIRAWLDPVNRSVSTSAEDKAATLYLLDRLAEIAGYQWSDYGMSFGEQVRGALESDSFNSDGGRALLKVYDHFFGMNKFGIPAALQGRLLDHIIAGNKMLAIKELRVAVNLGLKEAKDAVEAWWADEQTGTGRVYIETEMEARRNIVTIVTDLVERDANTSSEQDFALLAAIFGDVRTWREIYAWNGETTALEAMIAVVQSGSLFGNDQLAPALAEYADIVAGPEAKEKRQRKALAKEAVEAAERSLAEAKAALAQLG